MKIKKHIPNAITCGNLFCGCLAIMSAFHGDLVWSAYLVGIAAVLDFFDGFAARMLNVHSEIGKHLDSLADMVTFGVVPGVMMFIMIKNSFYDHCLENFTAHTTGYFNGRSADLKGEVLGVVGYLITIFSAIRLAKFNIDTRQTDSFIGVPTPANTMLIASLPLIINEDNSAITIIDNTYFLISITLIMSYLLVAELPLIALKFKNFTWQDNKIRFVFLGIAAVMAIIFAMLGNIFIALPFIIIMYILISVINNIIQKQPSHEIQSGN